MSATTIALLALGLAALALFRLRRETRAAERAERQRVIEAAARALVEFEQIPEISSQASAALRRMPAPTDTLLGYPVVYRPQQDIERDMRAEREAEEDAALSRVLGAGREIDDFDDRTIFLADRAAERQRLRKLRGGNGH